MKKQRYHGQSGDPASATPPTFGEQLVGITFNPANDDKVYKAKRLCADLADLLHEEMADKEETQISRIIMNGVYLDILKAQMEVVKALTLKY